MLWFQPGERELDLRRFHPDEPPVVLLGGLNVARAAGLARIPVIVASADPESPVFASRFCHGRVLLPPFERQGAGVEKLMRLGERLSAALGRSVPLFYGDDDYLNLILQNRGRLAQYFRFIVNDPEVAGALIDKQRFDDFTRERGLPVPRTLQWEELAGVSGPVLVKPKLKLDFEHSATFLRLLGRAGKARVFASTQELVADPQARALRDELLFQEYIPGDDRQIWSFHGYADAESRVLAWFTGRKIRTYPALTGVSTFLEIAHHDQLAAEGHRIVARAPLKGVFKIDFKQDPRSGRFLMLEVNARFNLWHYLAAANGLNVPRVAYDYLVHDRVPAATPRVRTNRRWLSLRLDYRAYRDLASRGELGLWRWLSSLAFSRKVYDVFAWTDPLPLARYWIRRVHRVPRVTARLTRWLFTA
jgi:predicted ATP-grasp superfamily ATP-dependent carboligase